MRLTTCICLAILTTVSLSAIGCQNSATQVAGDSVSAVELASRETAPNGSAEAQPVASDKPVKLKGYINVSSGCQVPTVELLEKSARDSERVELELIDFGTPDGSRRWRNDGFSCMTILIDGSDTVTFGKENDRKIVTFSFPPGFKWALTDLEACIKEALAGTLYAGSEPGALKLEAPTTTIRVTSRQVTIEGKAVGEVVVNGAVGIRFRTRYNDLPPLQRAERSAARLKRALASEFTPSQLRAVDRDGVILLAAGDKVICTADEVQADLQGTTAKKLALGWVGALKKAFAAAAPPG